MSSHTAVITSSSICVAVQLRHARRVQLQCVAHDRDVLQRFTIAALRRVEQPAIVGINRQLLLQRRRDGQRLGEGVWVAGAFIKVLRANRRVERRRVLRSCGRVQAGSLIAKRLDVSLAEANCAAAAAAAKSCDAFSYLAVVSTRLDTAPPAHPTTRQRGQSPQRITIRRGRTRTRRPCQPHPTPSQYRPSP